MASSNPSTSSWIPNLVRERNLGDTRISGLDSFFVARTRLDTILNVTDMVFDLRPERRPPKSLTGKSIKAAECHFPSIRNISKDVSMAAGGISPKTGLQVSLRIRELEANIKLGYVNSGFRIDLFFRKRIPPSCDRCQHCQVLA